MEQFSSIKFVLLVSRISHHFANLVHELKPRLIGLLFFTKPYHDNFRLRINIPHHSDLLVLLRNVCVIEAYSIDRQRCEFSTPSKLQKGITEALRNLEQPAITAD